MELKFSIVIPVYNVEKYLKDCIESVLQQDIEEKEIILVNDGSKDRSADICKDYDGKYDCILYKEQENQGLSSARNTGLNSASGKYVLFLDSDDLLEKNVLKELYDFLEKNNLDALTFDYKIFDSSSYRIENNNAENFAETSIISGQEYIEKYGQNMLPMAWLYVYRRGFLEDNQLCFYPGVYHEDFEWVTKWFALAKRVGYKNKCIYGYRMSEVSIMRSKNFKKCTDLVIISEIIHDRADKFAYMISEKVAIEVHKYASFVAWAALHSCCGQGFSLKELFQNDITSEKMTVLLEGNERYSLIRWLIRNKLIKVTDILICMLDKYREVKKRWRK